MPPPVNNAAAEKPRARTHGKEEREHHQKKADAVAWIVEKFPAREDLLAFVKETQTAPGHSLSADHRKFMAVWDADTAKKYLAAVGHSQFHEVHLDMNHGRFPVDGQGWPLELVNGKTLSLGTGNEVHPNDRG